MKYICELERKPKMNFDEVRDEVISFRDERDWAQFHNPKDLAISICLEAAELLEAFQWTGDDLEAADKRDVICEELADVFIYGISLADRIGADIPQIVEDKIRKNRENYPVDKSKGTARKYTEL